MTIGVWTLFGGALGMIAITAWVAWVYLEDPYVGISRCIKRIVLCTLGGALAGALAGWGWGVG